MKWFEATCTQEFFWHGKSHRAGDKIRLVSDELGKLDAADLIGNVRELEDKKKIETAVRSAPEKAIRRGRPKNAAT